MHKNIIVIRGATKRFVCRFQFPIEERRTFCETVRKTVGHVSFSLSE